MARSAACDGFAGVFAYTQSFVGLRHATSPPLQKSMASSPACDGLAGVFAYIQSLAGFKQVTRPPREQKSSEASPACEGLAGVFAYIQLFASVKHWPDNPPRSAAAVTLEHTKSANKRFLISPPPGHLVTAKGICKAWTNKIGVRMF